MKNDLPESAAIYGRALLTVYDAWVPGFSNAWVWRCPSRNILALYDREVSARHLEVGVGTGYFPDHCHFPGEAPRIDLLDIHPETLAMAAGRLARYQPRCHRGDVMAGFRLPETGYGSIAVNYLLHCLPGNLWDKGRRVFDGLMPYLDEGEGRLFGSTILGRGVSHGLMGRRLMAIYNRRGIFGNVDDSPDDLARLMEAYFPAHAIEQRGCVALFTGYRNARLNSGAGR